VTSWELWRQDDHGKEFRVRSFDDRGAAERAREELIARGHRQYYWLVSLPQAPEELFALAKSADWQRRCEAAEALARYDDDQSARALLDLLTDDANPAPIQVAAQALISRRDERGARLIFRAIALGDDDASEHLLYFTAGSAELGEHAIWSHAQRSAESGDEIARRGALELLRYVGHPSITNPESSG
jgi:hypothetical protein